MRRAVLAGVCLQSEADRFDNRMKECEALCVASQIEVVGTVTQRSRSMDPRTAFRPGKVNELTLICEELDADLIIFAHELSYGMVARLRKETGREVIDRTALILDIFSLRARSRQAKLQVELARLNYELPSVAHTEDASQRAQGGGYITRGAGESHTARVRRSAGRRIAVIRKELKEKEQDVRSAERRRSKSELGRVALVGYTNAGKSSLMNAILRYNQREERGVYADDMLFATLDSSVRNITYEGLQFLLYDTVGFVSELPHTLIEAFQSTLDSARGADLLIHVIDASDPLQEEKAQVTKETLQTIGAGAIPVLTVYSKCDRLNSKEQMEGLYVSSLRGDGVEEVLQEVVRLLYPMEEEMLCRIPYERYSLIGEYRNTVRVRILQEENTGVLVQVSGPRVRMRPFKAYEVKENENSLGHL
ncbi:MAG: GTPase HflX [Solobacterium sp.]|nr:GTPase HflX [Solobacterium sp.]